MRVRGSDRLRRRLTFLSSCFFEASDIIWFVFSSHSNTGPTLCLRVPSVFCCLVCGFSHSLLPDPQIPWLVVVRSADSWFPVAQCADSWAFAAVSLDLWYSVNGVLHPVDQLPSALWLDPVPYCSCWTTFDLVVAQLMTTFGIIPTFHLPHSCF